MYFNSIQEDKEMSRRVFRKVAKKYGVSVNDVKQEIKASITAAYINPPNDGVTKAYQQRVPCKGKIPTPNEFIRYAVGKAKTIEEREGKQ